MKALLANIPIWSRVVWFRNLSLRIKLSLFFMGLALMIGAAGGSGLLFVKKISGSMEAVVNLATPLAKHADSLVANVHESRVLTMDILSSASEVNIQQSLAAIENLDREFQIRKQDLEAILDKGQIDLDLRSASDSQKAFIEQTRAMAAAQLLMLAKKAEANQRLAEFEQQREKLQDLLYDFAQRSEANMAMAEDRGRTMVQAGTATVKSLDKLLENLYNNEYIMLKSSYKLLGYLTELQNLGRSYLSQADLDKLPDIENSFASAHKKSLNLIKKTLRRASSPQVEQGLQEVAVAFAKLADSTLQEGGMFTIYKQSLAAEQNAGQLQQSLAQSADACVLAVETVVDAGADIGAKAQQNAKTDASTAVRSETAIVFIGMAIGILLGLLFSRTISTPISQVGQMVQELEKGNLTSRLNMDRQDEVGQMAKAIDGLADNMQNEILTAFNKLAEGDFTFEATGVIREPLAKANAGLNKVMGQILVAGDQIASGSSQVSDSSQALSQGATEQAGSLEEITASMSEMASQTKQSTEKAAQANQLATKVRETAENGNQQMQEMVSAMGEIGNASQNISKIIKVIDEIAFQTNLLALNAAVEAAHAGQHGKGFAVVAEEVRNLAERSAKAAKETAELIEGSMQKAKNGTRIADRTAEALGEIVTGVAEVTKLVAEISAASNEQAQGITQVNLELSQIDQVTQHNTANAEESAAAAEVLSAQAAQLKQMLSRFKLATGLTETRSSSPRRAANHSQPKEIAS